MINFTKYVLTVGGLLCLWLLSPVAGWAQSTAQSVQNGIRIRGGACVPDQECKSDSATFTDTVRTGVTSRRWVFSTGRSVTASNPADSTVRQLFENAGSFTVSLFRTINGVEQPAATFQGVVQPRPQPFSRWRNDTTICQGERITLDPYPNGAPPGVRFKWYPKGDTTQSITVDSSGCYSVEVINQFGCSYQDRINVDVCGEQKQQQGVKWYFGANAGLDFQGGAEPITDGKLNTIEGSSSINNTKGQLLFYSDGITIFDRNGNPMPVRLPNGDTTRVPLGGNRRSTQSALIVPKPTCRGCEYLYHVYTASEIRGTRQLTYSIVDMRENGGRGAIVDRNIPISNVPATEQAASVRNDRDTTYWVITRDFNSNVFRVRHLTRDDAVSERTFALGIPIDSTNKAEGYIKIGPADTSGNGNRPMAVVVPGPPRNRVEIYTFNDSTGVLTGPSRTLDLGTAPPRAYGAEFSPDGKSLFVSMLADTNADGSQKGASVIYRFNLDDGDTSRLTPFRTLVDSSTTRQYGALQVAPDGRIYVAVKGAPSLAVIENPNATGILDSLRFNPTGQTLGGRRSQLGLPNQVANFNEPSNGPGFTYADTCAGSPTTFEITPNCPKLKEQYTLTFGDGSPPRSFTAAQPQQHTYNLQPGQDSARFRVSLRIVTQRSSGGICKDTTIVDTITILRTPDPFDLGPPKSACGEDLTLEIPSRAKIYVWLVNGAVRSRRKALTFRKDQFGDYEVIGIAANGGCFELDTVRVNIRRPPQLNLGPDTSFCQGRSYALGVPTVQGWQTFRWSTGQTTREIEVRTTGVYSVTATRTDAQGACVNTDTVRVTGRANPTLTATLTSPTTCTSINGTIVVAPNPGGRGYQYIWSRPDGTTLPADSNRLANVPVGAYTVRAIDAFTCYVDSTFALNSPANQLRITPRVRNALCSRPNSGTIALTVTGSRPTEYTWRDLGGNTVGTDSVLTNVVAGEYSVEVRDSGGCVAFADRIPVRVDTNGVASLGPDRRKCTGDTVLLQPLGGAALGATYRWSTGQTSPTIVVNQPGTYQIEVRYDAAGCIGRDTVNIAFSPKPQVSAGPPAAFCVGAQPVQLSGQSPAGGQWSGPNVDSTGRFTPLANLAGQTFSVTYRFAQNGCADSARRNITINAAPVVSVPASVTACQNSTASVLATGSPGATFAWSNGTTGAALRAGATGNYVVTATLNGCSSRDTTNVTVLPAPVYSITRGASLCVGDGGTATLRVSGTGLRFEWLTTNETTPTITVSRPDVYRIRVINEANCVATDSALVVDLCEPRINIPDAFTPNGDGTNDVFSIFSSYISNFEVRIYNRWGEVIYASNDPAFRWDGTYKGELCLPQMYPYVIKYRREYPPNNEIVRRGSVLLIR